METDYNKAWKHLSKGIALLSHSIAMTIATHKAATALVFSLCVNILLGISYMSACVIRETNSMKIMQLEQKNDSLRQADIKYIQYTNKDSL